MRSMETAGIRISETLHEANARTDRHDHERPYLCYVLKGSFVETSGGEARVCGPGMLIAHPAGEVHDDAFAGTGAACLNVELLPDFSAAEISLFDLPLAMRPGPPKALVDQLRLELRRPDAFSLLAVQGVALELLAWILRQPRQCRVRAIRVLEDRLTQGFAVSLDDVASEVGVSPVTLGRSFRRVHGCSPAEFGRRKRLEKACRLLKSSDPIGGIALACGFYDQSHFTNVFRAHAGLTPLQYRRVHS